MASSYVTDDDGSTFIAPSQRPDGTWRKPIKVKDGYVPQDEVPLYESKGKILEKNVPQHPVGFSEDYVRQVKEAALKKQSIPGLTASAAVKKKKKKKSNSEKQKPPPVADLLDSPTNHFDDAPKSKDDEWTTVGGKNKTTVVQPVVKVAKKKEKQEKPVEKVDPSNESSDPAKRIKNLRKRLREMELIAEKKGSGGKLEPEQLEKLSRKKEVFNEIQRLMAEFNLS